MRGVGGPGSRLCATLLLRRRFGRDDTEESYAATRVIPGGALAPTRDPERAFCCDSLERFGFEEAGKVAGEAGGFGDEAALQAR